MISEWEPLCRDGCFWPEQNRSFVYCTLCGWRNKYIIKYIPDGFSELSTFSCRLNGQMKRWYGVCWDRQYETLYYSYQYLHHRRINRLFIKVRFRSFPSNISSTSYSSVECLSYGYCEYTYLVVFNYRILRYRTFICFETTAAAQAVPPGSSTQIKYIHLLRISHSPSWPALSCTVRLDGIEPSQYFLQEFALHRNLAGIFAFNSHSILLPAPWSSALIIITTDLVSSSLSSLSFTPATSWPTAIPPALSGCI